MDPFLQIQQALWTASLVIQVVLIWKLIREGLLRRYPCFAAYLAVETVCGVLVLQLQYHSRDYAEAFGIYNLLIPVFRVGVAVELYERICEHFPGIGKFRFALAGLLLIIAAILAVSILTPDLAAQWVFPQTFAMIVRRFQGEILAGASLLAWIFFRYVLNIEQPFRPNVLNHWRIATIYFGVSGAASLALLGASGNGSAVHRINCAMLAADIGCFVAWIRLMHGAGEQIPWFQRLSPSQIQAAEEHHQDLLETVRSLPRAISDRLTEN